MCSYYLEIQWFWQIHKDNWDTEVIIGKNKVVKLKTLLPHHWHNKPHSSQKSYK